jgi:hypothetical protein
VLLCCVVLCGVVRCVLCCSVLPACVAGVGPGQQFIFADFDNFAIESATMFQCPTAAAGSPVTVQWCGEPNSANSEWSFDWTTGLIGTCPLNR